MYKVCKLKSVKLIPAFNTFFSKPKHVKENKNDDDFHNIKYTIGGLTLGLHNTIAVKNIVLNMSLLLSNSLDPNYSLAIGFILPKRLD
ncbi:MAG: hypothetical protein ACPG4W_04685 [Flavobacteriales bacterium]